MQHRGEQPERDGDQRCRGRGGALGGGVEEQRRLQALADTETKAMPATARVPTPMRRLELAGELALEPPGRAAHPEDHPGHQGDRDDGRDRLEQLPGPVVGQQRRLGVGEQGAEAGPTARPRRPRRPRAAPVPAPAGLHQVGDEDADDQRGLEALAQADQVAGEEGLTHDANPICDERGDPAGRRRAASP